VNLTPLRLIRKRTEKTLITRPFFARASSGELSAGSYTDLLAQLGEMVANLSPTARTLARFARRDLGDLGESWNTNGPCVAVAHFGVTARSCAAELPAEVALDAGLAVIGTSWCRRSAKRARDHGHLPSAFLEQLWDQGRSSLDRLEAAAALPFDPQHLYAFAELTRGALLGLATYLDLTWPAPLVMRSVILSE
jgi:hypothetical protein